MNTNILILDFFTNNFILLIIFVLLIVKIIPPEWSGFWKYNNNEEVKGKAPKITILKFIIHSITDSILSGFLIPILSFFTFTSIVTVIIFLVVGFGLFILREISGGIITLIGIAIIALYLEKLISNAKNIKLFGGLLVWEKDIK